MMKTCTICKSTKEKSEFYTWGHHSGREPYCKACRNEWNKLAYQKNKEKILAKCKERHFLKSYGMSLEELTLLSEKQNHQCLICNIPMVLGGKRVFNSAVVDHCHITGKVRGLLCTKCNQGLGMFNDDSELLKKAGKYINDNT